MRVRIVQSIEAGDEYRRAIRVWYGREGLADRDEVRRWIERHGSSMDDDLMINLDRTQEETES